VISAVALNPKNFVRPPCLRERAAQADFTCGYCFTSTPAVFRLQQCAGAYRRLPEQLECPSGRALASRWRRRRTGCRRWEKRRSAYLIGTTPGPRHTPIMREEVQPPQHSFGGLSTGPYQQLARVLCSRDNCAYWQQCEDEYGGSVRRELPVHAETRGADAARPAAASSSRTHRTGWRFGNGSRTESLFGSVRQN
jgi:hypothetical protein